MGQERGEKNESQIDNAKNWGRKLRSVNTINNKQQLLIYCYLQGTLSMLLGETDTSTKRKTKGVGSGALRNGQLVCVWLGSCCISVISHTELQDSCVHLASIKKRTKCLRSIGIQECSSLQYVKPSTGKQGFCSRDCSKHPSFCPTPEPEILAEKK